MFLALTPQQDNAITIGMVVVLAAVVIALVIRKAISKYNTRTLSTDLFSPQAYLLTTGAQEVFEIPPTELTMLSAPNQTRDTL